MNKMYEYLQEHSYILENKKSNYQFELSKERAVCISNKHNSLIEKLQQENEKNKHYKTLYQSLKRQKEELRSWLVEQEEKSWDDVSSTFGYVLDKLEEL